MAGPVTLQPQYSLLAREIEWEIVPAALDAGMGLLPWSPLGGGWLSGKYRRDQRPAGATRLGEDPSRGMEAYDRRGTDRTWHVIDAVQKIAEDRGVSMAEVALAWVTAQPAVSSTILGARTLDQLETNLRSAGLQLTTAETAALDAASDPHPVDYPYGELGVDQRSRALGVNPPTRNGGWHHWIGFRIPARLALRDKSRRAGVRRPSGRGGGPDALGLAPRPVPRSPSCCPSRAAASTSPSWLPRDVAVLAVAWRPPRACQL